MKIIGKHGKKSAVRHKAADFITTTREIDEGVVVAQARSRTVVVVLVKDVVMNGLVLHFF